MFLFQFEAPVVALMADCPIEERATISGIEAYCFSDAIVNEDDAYVVKLEPLGFLVGERFL